MNINQEKFDKEISEIASSVKREFGVEVDTKKVITEFCNLLEERLRRRIEFEQQ